MSSYTVLKFLVILHSPFSNNSNFLVASLYSMRHSLISIFYIIYLSSMRTGV